MLHKTYIILSDFFRQMKQQHISAFSASTAFFLFLSIVPMLILICTILPFTPLTAENLVKGVMEVMPDMVNDLVISIVADVYDSSAGIMSIAAVATLWTAGKGVLALIEGLNAVNGVEEKRNYFVVRIVACFYTVVMLVVVILSLLIMVFGNVLVNMILGYVPQLSVLFRFLVNFRFLVVWFVLTVLFTAVYAYVPNKKLRFREQVPGAVFTAVGWSVFSWGFSIYVGYSGNVTTYGSLSIIVLTMLWLYFCMYIMMIGAHLNRYFSPVNRALAGRTGKKNTKRS